MKRIPIIAISIVFSAVCAQAGGTVDFAHVENILRQKPDVAEYILSTLEFESSPFAEVRFGSHFTHLGGGRMGPYSLQAKPKRQAGTATLEVTICTAPTFLDKNGEKAADEFAATSVSERLVSVIIRDIRDTSHVASCPTDFRD